MFFEEIHILPKYPQFIFIQWRLDNSSLPENYFFDIYTSSDPVSGFEKINQVPIVNTYYYEHPFALLSKEEYLWVKIEAVAGNNKAVSAPQGLFYNLPKRQYLVVKEIIRKNDLIRRKKVGIKNSVYKRIVFGAPCPKCIDVHTGYGTDSRCSECYGTKKYGGYHDPIETWVEVVEGGRDIAQTEVGVIENRIAQANLTFPIVQKGDIIVEGNRNRRWYVSSIVGRNAIQTVPVDQKVEVRLISPKDIEYSL